MSSPPATEYEFAGHATHAAAFTAAVALLYRSTPQSVQGVEPTTFLCDPAGHAKHVPPSAPV
jgi:hypothetical protein